MNKENFNDTIMGKEEIEKEGAGEAPENKYEQYKQLGGIINEKDYQSAVDRAKSVEKLDQEKEIVAQTEIMARSAGITLNNSENSLDPRTKLYGILRHDENSTTKYHHSDMSDQRLFAETLRILGDVDSLEKLIKKHPHISF